MENFIVTKDIIKKVRRFNLTGRTLEFKISKIPEKVDPVEWIRQGIWGIFERGMKGTEPTDLVGFTFCNKDFARGDGWLRFRPASEVTAEDVWDIISNIYQSNSSGFNTDTFCLKITSVKMPKGKGRGVKYNTFNEECVKRRGIVSIDNKDNLCLPRALVVAQAYVDKDPLYPKVRNDTNKLQTIRTHHLMETALVMIPEEGAGVKELEQFQYHLREYKITVYNYYSKGRDVIFKGTGGDKNINLLFHDGHYNVITSLTAAFCCSYYCEECHVPYNDKTRHRCKRTCPACQQAPPCSQNPSVKCSDCKRSFRGQACFDNHTKEGSYGKSSVCHEISRCEQCFKTIRSDRFHICGEIYCKICKAHVPTPHKCFMPIDNGKPVMKDHLIIFYDLESMQEKILEEDGSALHEPTLCVFKQFCEYCLDTQLEICAKCGVRQQVLKTNPISRFVEYVMNQRKLFKKVIVVGHAGGLYDTQFILNYVMTKTDLKPELVSKGTKLLSLAIGNVKFIDSLNYFPMPLANLPKSFGLTGLKKGYFPHLFNTMENQNYIGPLPSVEYYGPDTMKTNQRDDFMKWHTELLNKNYLFDFQKEIVEYCISDVDILAQACLKFRELMIKEGNVDPFIEAITLPGACNKIFRRNFLKPDTIGIIPKRGYRWCNNQSKIAIKWFLLEERQRKINILHAAKQEEVVVAGVKVDGYCPETRQIFEFHGCYYHGCPRCIRYRRNDFAYDDPSTTAESRYESTISKVSRLREMGYEVIEKWECDFKKEITPEMESYAENHPLFSLTPLNPRDAFYGGRTDATKMYYMVKGEEKIKYVDVCSLYPWVNKYGKYPVGHPEVFVGDECLRLDLNETDGLIKCKIIPPYDLYHPVLPIKSNNKLMFPLCRTCCEKMIDDCNHTDDERALVGTWVVDEVNKALQKGYKLTEVYEIWKYKVEQYNPETKNGGLFANYISTFLKLKQQASGWPRDCDSYEKKNKYLQDYFEKEGVKLEFNEIDFNPGLRQVGKSVITSFWGKLGQRENLEKTSIINDSSEFFDILSRPFIEVHNVHPVNEETLIVNWVFKDEAYDVLPTVNVALAAYTTAQARLKLYSYLEQLEDRVLYYDTDSIIYVSRPGKYDVPLGSFLGDLTDELEEYGCGSFITEFVSGGPKLYAYRVYSPDKDEYLNTIKAKGITINHKTSKIVNFEKLRNMILNEHPPEYITTKNILRTRDHKVVTKEVTKIFRVNFKKRRTSDNYDSVPFGYKRLKRTSA